MKYCETRFKTCPDEARVDVWGVMKFRAARGSLHRVIAIKALCRAHGDLAVYNNLGYVAVDRRTGVIL